MNRLTLTPRGRTLGMNTEEIYGSVIGICADAGIGS